MQSKAFCLLIYFLLAALPVRGDNAMDYFKLGQESSMTRTKIKYFSKALELDPNLLEAYEKRGTLHFFQKNYDNVIKDFRAYNRLAPPKAEAYRMLGMGYLKSGDAQLAIYNFTRAMEIDSNLADTYSNRAEANYTLGKYEKTLSDSTRAIELGGDPKTIAEAYRIRARAYRKTGRNELAAVDVRSSWLIDPRYAKYMQSFYSYASPDELRKAGVIAIIGIAFVLIFSLKLKPPSKDD